MNHVRGQDEFWDAINALPDEDPRRIEVVGVLKALGEFGPVFPADHPYRAHQKVASVQQGQVFRDGYEYDLEDGSGSIEYSDLEDEDDHYITVWRLVWL